MLQTMIRSVSGREILDSRGNPTVEACVELADGTKGLASVPSGASTGMFEAKELRDRNARYGGLGVQNAVHGINTELCEALKGESALEQQRIDQILLDVDGTEDKSHLGANAMLAVSLAAARAAAVMTHRPLYRHLGGIQAAEVPLPMCNILNGGAHTGSNVEIQEFMIVPVGACCLKEGLRKCVEVYHMLGSILKAEGLSTAVGDEGGYAPDLEHDEAALEFILLAIEKAGYHAGTDFVLALDAAASEWKGDGAGQYRMPKSGRGLSREELIQYWANLCGHYPIASLEDPMDENDWEGWKTITSLLGKQTALVGDDLFVTNSGRLLEGVERKCANAILIKPNQIGTLSETLRTIRLAKKHGYRIVLSHRSGETEDTFLSDLAVAVNAGWIKSGAPCRGERTAKYNRLLAIEKELQEKF